MTRVFVSNRIQHVCDVLQAIVNGMENFQVVGSYTSGRKLFEALPVSKPALCILDIGLDYLDGFRLMRLISNDSPDLKVLVLTDRIHPYTVQCMIKWGARGFTSVKSTRQEISDAIRNVDIGYHYNDLAPESLFSSIQTGKMVVNILTERQQRYIQYCYEGIAYRDMAMIMGISLMTFKDYRELVFRNLGVKNRADMIRIGVESGLIRLNN